MTIWKFILTGGLLSLLLGSGLMIWVLYRMQPYPQSRKKISLRDQHDEPISRFGGVAIAWSYFISLAFLIWLTFGMQDMGMETLPLDRMTGLILGALLAWGLGFADDLWNVRARWKLAGQIGLGVLAVYFGFSINKVHLPFFQNISLGIWAIPITVFWIVGVINAINLIDGLDGLASGVVLVALAVLAWIAQDMGKIQLMLLTVVLIGSVFSFWTFNWPPASIFMGDSGSYFLGYLISLLSLWVTTKPEGSNSLLPLLILAVPIIDTVFSLFRRLLKGIPFYSADKDHLHHRLIYKGFSPSQAMIALLGVSMTYGVIALGAFHWPLLESYNYLGGIALAWSLLYLMEYDVIRQPVSSIRDQNVYRKRREMMIALAKNMDYYLEKDLHQEMVLKSFKYWSGLAGISKFKILKKNKVFLEDSKFEDSLRIVIYKHGDWEVQLGLPESSWKIDSDVKAELMQKASMALTNRLDELENNNVLSLDSKRA